MFKVSIISAAIETPKTGCLLEITEAIKSSTTNKGILQNV